MGDNQIQAHKVILSACSPFFRNILRHNPHQHPLLYLKGVKYREVLSVLNFMYVGEVNVAQEELNSFLTVAEDLKVKGLAQGNTEGNQPESKTKRQEAQEATKPKLAPPRPTAPPPKRPRFNHPNPPQVIPSPAQIFHQEVVEDDIQEVNPVKNEPQEMHSHPSYIQEEQQQHEQEHGQGTVALDYGYAVDEGYDYQYEEATGYNIQVEGGQGTKGPRPTRLSKKQAVKVVKAVKVMKDVKEVKEVKVVKKVIEVKEKQVRHDFKAFAQAWQCEECKTVFSSRKYAKEHMLLNN